MIDKLLEFAISKVSDLAMKRFEKDSKAKEILETVQRRRKQGELEEARKLCLILSDLRPESDEVYFLLSSLQYELKEYDKSLKSINEAITLKSVYKYYDLKGDILQTLERYQESINIYEQAVQLVIKEMKEYMKKYDDEFPKLRVKIDALKSLERHRLILKDHSNLIEPIRRKKQVCEDKYWELQGDELESQCKYAEAITAYDKVSRISPYYTRVKGKRDACEQKTAKFLLGSLFPTTSNVIFNPLIALAKTQKLPMQPTQPPVELKSDRNIDYQVLEQLLKEKNWLKADELTSKLMLEVSNRERERWMNTDVIHPFPCKDLQTIDQLWMHYSNGKFGFSIQKNLWLKCGGEVGKYNVKVWENFVIKVGWCHPPNKVVQNAIPASLPMLTFGGGGSINRHSCLVYLIERLESCDNTLEADFI